MIPANDEIILKRILEDPVTGLANRNSLESDLASGEYKNAIVLDLNNFSDLNEFYGDDTGNIVLKTISEIVNHYVRNRHEVYRSGGDEFIVLSREQTGIVELAESLIHAIRIHPIPISSHQNLIAGTPFIYASATAGIALESTRPYRHAITALRLARSARDPYRIYEEGFDWQTRYQKNVEMTSRVLQGILRDQVTPFYQPIVDAATGEVRHREALVRIVDDTQDIISAGDVLRVAWITNQYRDLTAILLRKVLEDMETNDHRFSVNLSYDDIQHKPTADLIRSMIEESGFAERLTLEITETEDQASFEVVRSFIHNLKAIGCSIALDDFGSGFSNFTNLIQIQADYLKIDGSLVKNIISDQRSREVVRFLVDFCKANQMKTVAEFVSSADLATEVHKLGVDFAQGYYYGKPELLM